MRVWPGVMALLLWTSFCDAKKPDVQDSQALAATHGYVFANLPKPAEILQVTPVAGGKPIALLVRTGPGTPSQGRWLPEGDYYVSKWGLSTWLPAQPFHVQAGRVTDLGSLVAIGIGGYARIYVSLRPAEEAHSVDGVLREFDAVLADKDPIRWRQDTPSQPSALVLPGSGMGLIADLFVRAGYKNAMPPKVRALLDAKTPDDLLERARDITPPMYEEAATDAADTLYFGADLGRLRVRDATGHWTSVGMDTLHTISAVEWAEGALVTGSDDGVLRRSTDAGKTWTELKRLDGVAVIDIDQSNGTWLVTTSHATIKAGAALLDRVSVLKATKPDLSDLTNVRDFPVNAKDLLGWMGARPQLDKRWFTLGLGKLHRLDLESMTWKELQVPSVVTMHRIDEKSGLVTAFLAKGVFSKIYVSADHGDTWTQVGRPPYAIFDVQFDAPDHGYASRLNMDAVSSKWETYAFDASINDWKQTSESPRNCRPLRTAMSQPVLCLQGDASIHRLEGGKWVNEVDTHIAD